MEESRKSRFFLWVVIIFIIMNAATIATILFYVLQPGKTARAYIPNYLQSERRAQKFSSRYFQEQLNLSDEQHAAFRKMNPAFRQETRNIVQNINILRKRIFDELTAPASDTIYLYQLSDSIGQLHGQLKKLTCRYYLNLKRICNDEQQKKLEILFQPVLNNEMQQMWAGKHYRKRYRQNNLMK